MVIYALRIAPVNTVVIYMWKLSINQPGETKSRGRSLLYAKLADFLGKKKNIY